MLCSKCGKENDNKNKFCSNCGAVLDNTPSQSMPKHKGGKKILLLGIFCCLIIVSIFSFKAYSKYSTYQSGIKSLNAGDYETAKKTFASISDYKDSSNYIDECTYQQALVDLNNETYDNAIIAFEALGDYKDSTTCLEKAKMGRKYSLFNQDVDSDKVDLNTILDSPDSVEENISPLYKEWYNSSTGESLVIDAFQINGRDYMVKYVTILDGWADTVFCYVDDPDHTFDILPYFDYFDYISESVETVVLLSHKKADSYIHIDVEFGEGEGKIPVDSIAKRAEAYKPKEKVTYKMIKEYIEAKYGFKVHTAYIAEVKRDLGLPMYDAPNAVEELKQPRKHPTPEKVEAIKDALRYFAVI